MREGEGAEGRGAVGFALEFGVTKEKDNETCELESRLLSREKTFLNFKEFSQTLSDLLASVEKRALCKSFF
jgi:hypothetical protein